MLRILYIYRHPDMGFSIGKVFKQIEEEMKKYAEVYSVYLPVPNYSLKGLWMNVKAVRKVVGQKRYDIVHITGAEHYLIPFLWEENIVVTVHDLGFCRILKHKLSYPLKYRFFVSSLKKASFVTFISEKAEQEVLEYVRLKKGKYAVIHNPVGIEFQYKEKTFNNECPRILHIGTKEHKNLDRSIEALKGVRCHLRIIGKVSESQMQRMKDLGIQYSVGVSLTDEELLEEYYQTDIINFPSLYEGFGMPIVEGQAVGRVIITSDIEPMCSVAGKGAIWVNPESVASMHDAYEKAMKTDIRNEVIGRGLENVKRFQLKDIAYKYFSVYSKIFGESKFIKNFNGIHLHLCLP